MSIEVLSELWDEKAFNPSARHQSKGVPNLEKVITEKVEQEVFSCYPELVAGGIQVDIIDSIHLDMVDIYIKWKVWMPVGIKQNVVTLENVKTIIRMQLSSELLEDDPDAFSIKFGEALDIMEEQMEKVKWEFAKKGIDPNIVAPALKKYSLTSTKIVKVPILPKRIRCFP
jgi:hypothetical protein